MTKPKLVENNESSVKMILAEHPCVVASGIDMVPNNIYLNTYDN